MGNWALLLLILNNKLRGVFKYYTAGRLVSQKNRKLLLLLVLSFCSVCSQSIQLFFVSRHSNIYFGILTSAYRYVILSIFNAFIEFCMLLSCEIYCFSLVSWASNVKLLTSL